MFGSVLRVAQVLEDSADPVGPERGEQGAVIGTGSPSIWLVADD
ncbi:hypothetical protein [Mycobacterium uberis]|nr:hypothetical protein [Mycobacterium uberis]